ncbi:hypothetical protein J2847_000479 [Azospirillum agricola]|nr:hypothetical protein [Azospirillum agricola]
MLGLGTAVTPLRGVPAVAEQARINLETVKPALTALGYTAAEQADIAERYTAKAIQDHKDSVAFLQTQGRVALDSLVDPSARLSVKDGLKAAGFDVADSGLSGVIAALQGLEGAAVGGTLGFAAMGEALTTINAALSDGVISGDQYSTLLGSITAAWNQSQAVAGARRSGRIAFETALDPAWRADTDTLLTEAGLTAGAIDALRGSFTSVADGARTGTLSAGQLRTAYDGLEAQLDAGAITTDAFTAAVGLLTDAWSESARTARALASYQTDVTARMLTAVGNARGAGLATLDAQQANELAEAQANGYDTSRLLLVQAAERARQAFDLAQTDLLEAYDRQIEAQQIVAAGGSGSSRNGGRPGAVSDNSEKKKGPGNSRPFPQSDDRCLREGLVGDQRKGVADARQGLDMLGHETADVVVLSEIALHQKIVLAGDGMHLRHRFNLLDRLVGDQIGLSQLALDHDEDGLHGLSPPGSARRIPRPSPPPGEAGPSAA